MADDLVTASFIPNPQELPAWLSYSTYITTIEGTVYTTETVINIPQTYWGPPISLNHDWTYGGLTSPASIASETTSKEGNTAIPLITTTTLSSTTTPRTTVESRITSISATSVSTASQSSPSTSTSNSHSSGTGSTTVLNSATKTSTLTSSLNGVITSTTFPTSSIPIESPSQGITHSNLLLSILLPILFTILVIATLISCRLFRRARLRRQTTTGGQYVAPLDGLGGIGNSGGVTGVEGVGIVGIGTEERRGERERLRVDQDGEGEIVDAGMAEEEVAPMKKRWLNGVVPAALRRRTASARGRVPSNNAWSDELLPEVADVIDQPRDSVRVDSSASRREASDSETWHEYAYLRTALDEDTSRLGDDIVELNTPINNPSPRFADSPPQDTEGAVPPPPQTMLGRLGLLITPRVFSQNHRVRVTSTSTTGKSPSDHTSRDSSNPTAFGTPKPSELFFNVPSPPNTPPPPVSAGATAMPDMSAFRDLPERNHVSLIYPDRLGDTGEMTSLMTPDAPEAPNSNYRDPASRRTNFPSQPPRATPQAERSMPGLGRGVQEGDVVTESISGEMLRPLDARRFTGESSVDSTSYFSLPPSPAKQRPPPLQRDRGSHGEPLIGVDASGNRPLSISAVGGPPTITPVQTPTSARGDFLSTPESARIRSQSMDQNSPGRGVEPSLFGGMANFGSSDPELRLSMRSYAGQPLIDEATYLRAMGLSSESGLLPVPGLQPSSHSHSASDGNIGESGYTERGPPLSAVQSRMSSVASGSVDEFGQNWRPAALLSTQVTRHPSPGLPASASGSIYTHNTPNSSPAGTVVSGGSGFVDVEMLGATYSAAALRGRRSMHQLVPTSEALSSRGHGVDEHDRPLAPLPSGPPTDEGTDEGRRLLPASSTSGPGPDGAGRDRRRWMGRFWTRDT